ncbi:MAG: diadenosine tetraphosphate (Ap4A) HIT family hydrolase [Halieaceae bacterium]|jgi:diadenosine tetraphosphate (Ap4A) HIT family hydrolase
MQKIHTQLAADCHSLGRFSHSTVLLQRNAALPWFILVPDTELLDLLDLAPADLAIVLEESQRLGRFLKDHLGYPRLNFAGLGNVVPQMHLHIIARAPGDACWPAPVWGSLTDGGAYSEQTLSHWSEVLVRDFGLVGW